jgi:hypothetical protein
MVIEIYATSPDQEFVGTENETRSASTTVRAPEPTGRPVPVPVGWKKAPYSSGPGVFYQRWDALKRAIQSDRPLKDFVALRRDEQCHGFIHSLWRNLVFFADAEAFDLVSSLLDSPLSEVEKRAPWILDKLALREG